MLILNIWEFSKTFKSLLSVLQELEIKTGQHGYKEKLNQIQFTFASKVIQFVFYQDVLLQFATTDTQELDIHATKRLKHAHQKEDLKKKNNSALKNSKN